MIRTALGAFVIAFATVVACGNGSDNASSPGSQRDAGTGADASKRDASTTNGDASPSGGPLSFTATAEEAPPADAKLVVIWTVTSGSPDYSYSFGSGSTNGTQVFVSFAASPPAEALVDGKLGVGVIALVDAADAPPEGKLASGQFDPTRLLAFAPDYAIVFRNTTETLLPKEWDATFPQGFACGRCKRAPSQSESDTFEPTECSSVKVALYSKNLSYCKWN
jgi:hypothetical protein